jgi:hypothetical protein
MFPTICDLLDIPLPERPLDGISLRPVIEGEMTERPQPICFWDFDTRHETESGSEPYIEPALQEGTTPLVKKMDGRLTRSFRNVHHSSISELDFAGPRAILDNRYKLVLHDDLEGEIRVELFDLLDDSTETNDLAGAMPAITKDLREQLRNWQQSVLESLTGADYR